MVRRIKKAAVIGCGIMGSGITALLAGAGIDVLCLDIVPTDLKDDEKKDPAARNRIINEGLERIKKARPPLLFSKESLERITLGNLEDDFDKLADYDWIVEVIVEDLEIKKGLFERIDAIRRPDSIISSNTSGIPLRELAEGRSQSFREHFLITHFFNPVRYMHLLETIPGVDTKKEVLDYVDNFATVMLGKGMVWAKDTPNFIGNRIGIFGICKQLQLMLEDGITVAEVDAIMGAPISRPRTATFGTCDLVGMDTIANVVRNTYAKCPNDEERDAFILPPFVQTMLEKKQYGNKTKCGFFKTDVVDGKKIKKTINPATGEHEVPAKLDYPCLEAAKKAKTLGDKLRAAVYGEDKLSKFAWKANAATYIYSANRVPEIADTVVDIDNGMKWGYNWEAGPFESWDALGVKESVEKMEKDGMKVPAHVKKMLAKGATSFYKLDNGVKKFWDFATESYQPIKLNPKDLDLGTFKAEKKVALSCPSASLIDIGDGVFCLEFTTKMNSLNVEIFEFMPKAYDYVDKNGVGLVVGNQSPAAFSAGGDLKGMLEAARAGKFDDLDNFMKSVHAGMMGLRYSAYPTVAAAFGRTLGGGAEVCLACDRIVAHMELNMALVEIGAGLMPGGCGLIQLWRKFTTAKPEAATITDLAGFFVPIFKMVVQPVPSMSAAEARSRGFLGLQDRIVMNRDLLIGEAKKEVLKMADDGYTAPMKKKIAVFGKEAQGMIDVELKNMSTAGMLPPHMEHIARQICWCLSGGDVPAGTMVSEDYLMELERKAFVDLWRTENTQKMAEHIMTTGKSLLI